MKVRGCNDYYLSDKAIALTRYKEPQRTTIYPTKLLLLQDTKNHKGQLLDGIKM